MKDDIYKLGADFLSHQVSRELDAVKGKLLLGALAMVLGGITVSTVTVFAVLSLITYKPDLGAQLMSIAPESYLLIAVVVLLLFCIVLLVMLARMRKVKSDKHHERMLSEAATTFFRETTHYFEHSKKIKLLTERNAKLESALNILIAEMQQGGDSHLAQSRGNSAPDA